MNQKFLKLSKEYSYLLSKSWYKVKHREGPKILTPKQMLQILPIAFAQVKADNTNEIRQFIHSLYRTKQVTYKYITVKQIQ